MRPYHLFMKAIVDPATGRDSPARAARLEIAEESRETLQAKAMLVDAYLSSTTKRLFWIIAHSVGQWFFCRLSRHRRHTNNNGIKFLFFDTWENPGIFTIEIRREPALSQNCCSTTFLE